MPDVDSFFDVHAATLRWCCRPEKGAVLFFAIFRLRSVCPCGGSRGVRLSSYLQKGEARPPKREGAVQPPVCPHAISTSRAIIEAQLIALSDGEHSRRPRLVRTSTSSYCSGASQPLPLGKSRRAFPYVRHAVPLGVLVKFLLVRE